MNHAIPQRRRLSCRSYRARGARRRGITIIIVLTLIAITLSLSYAMMRTQMTAVQIQNNGSRNGLARLAALTGLSTGMRKMHENAWAGVNTTIAGQVSALDSYCVTFTAGDPALPATDPMYPFRVTIVSTGTSCDAAHAEVVGTHRVRAVVQLVPKQLGAQPGDWSSMRQYTVYQFKNGQFSVDLPSQVAGPLRLQGSVQVAPSYSWSLSERQRYLADLNAMRTGVNEVQTVSRTGSSGNYKLTLNGQTSAAIAYNATASTVATAIAGISGVGSGNVGVTGSSGGPYSVTFTGQLAQQNIALLAPSAVSLNGGTVTVTTATEGGASVVDWRPLTGPVSLPVGATDATNLGLLTGQLALTTSNISVTPTPAIPFPNQLSSYKIYPGGPTYAVPQLAANLTNTTLGPTATNPLGIFFCSSTTAISDNVTVNGSLVCSGELDINGVNVVFSPLNLPALDGTATPVRLPAAAVKGLLQFNDGVGATITGFLLVGQQFNVAHGQEGTNVSIVGRVFTNDFVVQKRDSWNYNSLTWDLIYNSFISNLATLAGWNLPYFPIQMYYWGRNPAPTITVRTDSSTPVLEQWQDLSSPIYIADPADIGLKWDLVSWTDCP